MKKHLFSPESLMMSYGYDPKLSEGAIKCPIFQTSTFVFNSAEEGKAFFEVAYGKRQKRDNEETGLIYSRINNPDLEILEDRLCLWDRAEACAVFESGMSAISTVLLEFLKPGDVLVHSAPVYGGTDHFIHHFLPKIGIDSLLNELTSLVNKGALSNNETIVTNSRHFEALNNALESILSVQNGIDREISSDLFAIDIRECLRHLANITGEYDVDKDISGHIFSNFCIGK